MPPPIFGDDSPIDTAGHGSGDKEDSKVVKFDPPLYTQRYEAVMDELKAHYDVIEEIVDFGCAECKFLRRVRNGLSKFGTHTFIGVDVDGELLARSVPFLQPKPENIVDDKSWTETLLYKGSIAEYDNRLAGVDAVVAIELIEHLTPDTLAGARRTIFERIEPYVVILTTPNVEFNVLFDMGNRRFRHDDHKFEWTRQEFRNWCSGVVELYPEYDVVYGGVGAGPRLDDVDELGFCSQMAVFRQKDKRAYCRMKGGKLRRVGGRPYELISRIVDKPKFTPPLKQRVLSHCQKYFRDRLNEALETGNTGVWISFNDLLHSSPLVTEVCENVNTLAQLVINRDDYGSYDWRIKFDFDEDRIYYEIESYEDEQNEEEEEIEEV